MSDSPSIEVQTSARLHLGLWAWGQHHWRQFGGVGLMVREPELRIQFTAADEFCAVGPSAERIRRAVEACRRSWQHDTMPSCRVEALTLPPGHVGFGVGTQLALSVAQGLAAWMGREVNSTEQLAVATGRGLRSAVGTHGFGLGGLIVDAGKTVADAIGKLAFRVAVPDEWRIVLVTPRGMQGRSGAAERSAFAKLPPIPASVTDHLQQLATQQMVPACESGDFERFASALYEYGYTAGMCFKSVQGGAYASEEICRNVEFLRSRGSIGVGQTSWGPTVYAFMPDERSAVSIAADLQRTLGDGSNEVIVTSAQNVGARVIAR